ncbi:hypothetical protein ACI48D_12545 [Massilia sp. LXY-6]|uniref:hypothetical protein n=1 Tax=Massilia sp. LXY-6 TaxID=3379823 RepID=UPI003EE103F3
MASRTTLVLLASAALLVAISMHSGIDIGLAWATLISAMVFELVLWKRGLDRVRAVAAARHTRRRLR